MGIAGGFLCGGRGGGSSNCCCRFGEKFVWFNIAKWVSLCAFVMATLFRDVGGNGSPPSPKERGKFDKLLFDTLLIGLGGGAFVPGGFGGGSIGRPK